MITKTDLCIFYKYEDAKAYIDSQPDSDRWTINGIVWDGYCYTQAYRLPNREDFI